jgi:hypothetical protein
VQAVMRLFRYRGTFAMQKILAMAAALLLFCEIGEGFTVPCVPLAKASQIRSKSVEKWTGAGTFPSFAKCSTGIFLTKMSDDTILQAPKTTQSRGSVVISGGGELAFVLL